MLGMNEIRQRFLTFFKERGHEIVRSSSLVPKDDPSLLFTNAGMVQFKTIFQGLEKRDYDKATTSQKCLRVGGKHNDLENVGRTARHHTFFEMLGNFSFGDYFKKEAICLAWEFITVNLELPKDKLWATIYLDDDEAHELWLKHTEIPAERIVRLGEADNFWSMGDTGPCGPCTEILYDQGEEMSCGPNCGIGKCDCDRYLEIWNLVFMQFNQLESGEREKLAKPSIDTGMGLERISAICQGVYSNYDTDLFRSIIDYTCELAQVEYSQSMPDTNDVDTSLRVIADHSRAIAFMIADGIMPSNEGRGYVLRRLIRRAYRFGTLIGTPESFLYLTTKKVVELMGESFPELRASEEFMMELVKKEEERFAKTLDKGLEILEEEMQKLKKDGKNHISGETAFRLYDTYGFPLDIVNDVCQREGFDVDEDGFKLAMNEQKERAKAAWKGSGESDITARFAILLEDGLSSIFVGYDTLFAASRITALLSSDGEAVKSVKKGQKAFMVAGQTPFYGASGGQEGDTGIIKTHHAEAKVIDTLKPSENLIVHEVEVIKGELLLDAEVELTVEEGSRMASARNHTATHLLHAALKNILGKHVNQAGSLVSPSRLRFDFSHMSAVTPEELQKIEDWVNRAIMTNTPVSSSHKSYDEAIAGGAVALFGEKYDDEVRVIKIDGESTELCGGTHLERTGDAGPFIIISESGIAANTRRIEAATGWNTLKFMREQRTEIEKARDLLKAQTGECPERIEGLMNDLRDARKELQKVASQAASDMGKDLLEQFEKIQGVDLLVAQSDLPSMRELRRLMDDLKSKVKSGIICLASQEEDKAHMILFVSEDLHDKFKAPALIKEISIAIDGSGGGRPDMAQAGGTNPDGISKAFELLKEIISK